MATNNDNTELEQDGPGGKTNMPGAPEVPDSMSMDTSKADMEGLKQDIDYTILPSAKSNVGATTPGEEEGITDDEDDDVRIVMGTEADVTAEDLQLLGDPDQDMDMGDDETAGVAGLDDTDFEGDPLNEAASDIFTTGDDLDIPKGDDMTDETGEGDEENDYYSLDDNGDDDNDNA